MKKLGTKREVGLSLVAEVSRFFLNISRCLASGGFRKFRVCVSICMLCGWASRFKVPDCFTF